MKNYLDLFCRIDSLLNQRHTLQILKTDDGNTTLISSDEFRNLIEIAGNDPCYTMNYSEETSEQDQITISAVVENKFVYQNLSEDKLLETIELEGNTEKEETPVFFTLLFSK